MTSELAPVLTALSDPTRRRVVQLLSERPLRAGELAAASGTSAPTMSRHLRVLLRAGIVADERPAEDARTRVFWLRP
ncbi:MAG TPA: metalloregulator ArsR/SmtB family transcription factor, partial [Gaiellaceae bacterium]|nr:metalloregulator ArsR/SmtB family transcription factor [Gaiellaceae bacterium]